MSQFANEAAFNQPSSYKMATGVDLRARNAITDPHGNVLAYAQTGGMINPQRHPLPGGASVFRFGGKGATPQSVAKGGWWIEAREFEKILSFANEHGLHASAAARFLCIVPPEWSDMTMLVRCRVRRPLLAWRGVGNSVVTPREGGGLVNLPHQNEIAARRLYQLFVPGLGEARPDTLAIEGTYPFEKSEGLRGWLYL